MGILSFVHGSPSFTKSRCSLRFWRPIRWVAIVSKVLKMPKLFLSLVTSSITNALLYYIEDNLRPRNYGTNAAATERQDNIILFASPTTNSPKTVHTRCIVGRLKAVESLTTAWRRLLVKQVSCFLIVVMSVLAVHWQSSKDRRRWLRLTRNHIHRWCARI